MAHLLRIVRGANTLTLNSGDWSLISYTPRTPELSEQQAASDLDDGGEQPVTTRRNVSEAIRLRLNNASVATLQADVQALETELLYAERRQRTLRGDKVYLEFQPDSGASVWRSEILAGKVEPSERIYGVQWPNRKLDVALVVKRRHYWEGPEAEISLSNGGGSGTGGRTIYNHDDGGAGHDNWVRVAAGAIAGALPTPPRIQITNNYASATRAYDLYLGLNATSDPANFTHVLEAENGSLSGGGTVQANAAASNGSYVSWSWSGTSEWVLFDTVTNGLPLSSALLEACRGNSFRLQTRFFNDPVADVQLKFQIYLTSSLIWEGPWNLLSTHRLQDLGVIQLPPYLVDSGSLKSLKLIVVAKSLNGGSHAITIDCIHLMPVDSWRQLSPRGYGLAQNERLIDDGIEQALYVDDGAGATRSGHYIGYGKPVMLWPGAEQVLYVLHRTTVTDTPIARTLSVRMYYRPRKLTI